MREGVREGGRNDMKMILLQKETVRKAGGKTN